MAATNDMSSAAQPLTPLPPGTRVALIAASWHTHYIDQLLHSAQTRLHAAGLAPADTLVVRVPGSWELPYAALRLLGQPSVHGAIAIGILIRGDTDHYHYLAQSITIALQQVCLQTAKPLTNALLTVHNIQQVIDRCGGPAGDKGIEAADALIQLLNNETLHP